MEIKLITRETCPICNFSSSEVIFKRKFTEETIKEYLAINFQGHANIEFLNDGDFEIVRCNKCGGSYQKHVLNDAGLAELYDQWVDPSLAEEWNKNLKSEKRDQYGYVFNLLKNHTRKETGQIKVLDFGAGFGDSLMIANELGFETYAYEFSRERIQFLTNKGIKVLEANSKMLFDLIIVNNVLEHVTYPSKELEKINLHLGKSGLVYLAVPDCPNMIKRLRIASKINDATKLHSSLMKANVGAFQHINYFTNRSLKVLLNDNGLVPLNPFRRLLFEPRSIKALIRPFYRYYFGTTFFLKKL